MRIAGVSKALLVSPSEVSVSERSRGALDFFIILLIPLDIGLAIDESLLGETVANLLQARNHTCLFRALMARYAILNNGGRSSMVELQIVVLAVAGSNPVGRPVKKVENIGERFEGSAALS
jgi:hypothetical protein